MNGVYKVSRFVILSLFFVSCLWLSAGIDIFNSPDENANFIFATHFASENNFKIYEPDNLMLSGLLHPRSAFVLGDFIVPVSFLGFPLLASLVMKIFGQEAALFLTPLLAVLAIYTWRQIILLMNYDKKIADLAALALMVHPAFWYYSGRVMMHNVAFVAFLLFAFWAVIIAYKRNEVIYWFLAGLLFSIAFIIRMSEIIWILVILLFVVWYFRKKISLKSLSVFALGAVLVLTLMAYLNVSTYGSVLTSGYTVQTVVDELATKVTDNNVVSADFWDNILTRIPFAQYIFPFGIHEKNILTNVVGYGFWLYFWLAIPSLIGLFLMWQKNNLRERLYVLITAFVFVWLSIVYGSWSFNDNPDPSIITLGNSYARYWLPIFVLLSLPAAIALEKLSKVRFDKHKMIFIASLLLIVGLSAMRVFSGQDGFINSRNNLRIMMEKKKVVLENTPDEAIIIADMADKYLWPDRKVITPLRSDATYNILPIAVDCRPVFYFGITLPDKDLKYLKEVKLASDQLYFKPIISINDETLYKVMKNENEK